MVEGKNRAEPSHNRVLRPSGWLDPVKTRMRLVVLALRVGSLGDVELASSPAADAPALAIPFLGDHQGIGGAIRDITNADDPRFVLLLLIKHRHHHSAICPVGFHEVIAPSGVAAAPVHPVMRVRELGSTFRIRFALGREDIGRRDQVEIASIFRAKVKDHPGSHRGGIGGMPVFQAEVVGVVKRRVLQIRQDQGKTAVADAVPLAGHVAHREGVHHAVVIVEGEAHLLEVVDAVCLPEPELRGLQVRHRQGDRNQTQSRNHQNLDEGHPSSAMDRNRGAEPTCERAATPIMGWSPQGSSGWDKGPRMPSYSDRPGKGANSWVLSVFRSGVPVEPPRPGEYDRRPLVGEYRPDHNGLLREMGLLSWIIGRLRWEQGGSPATHAGISPSSRNEPDPGDTPGQTGRAIGNGRLGIFLMTAILGVLFWRDVVGLVWPVAGLVAFVVLVVVSGRVVAARRRAEGVAAYHARGLSRLDDQWSGTGNPGTRFLDEEHPYAADLDLFGVGSLFERLCMARTASGEATLASWLLQPASPPEIPPARKPWSTCGLASISAKTLPCWATTSDRASPPKRWPRGEWCLNMPFGLDAAAVALAALFTLLTLVLGFWKSGRRVPFC